MDQDEFIDILLQEILDLRDKISDDKKKIRDLEIIQDGKVVDGRPVIILFVCPLCQQQREKLVRHHYQYFPEEKTILICQKCNSRPHLRDYHPILNPPVEDAQKFYNRYPKTTTKFELPKS